MYCVFDGGLAIQEYSGVSQASSQPSSTHLPETEFIRGEGMRFRDLETGTFLTRDPIGYGGGPNVYCYVHCNPINAFDPLGLTVDWVSMPDNDFIAIMDLYVQDSVFADQIDALDASPNSWSFDSGQTEVGVTAEYTDSSGNIVGPGNDDIADMTPTPVTEYVPGVSPDGNGGGTISWSASQDPVALVTGMI